MDPNETLRRIREIVTTRDAHGQRVELCELVRALDGWLTGGGFLPDEWSRKKEP